VSSAFAANDPFSLKISHSATTKFLPARKTRSIGLDPPARNRFQIIDFQLHRDYFRSSRTAV